MPWPSSRSRRLRIEKEYARQGSLPVYCCMTRMYLPRERFVCRGRDSQPALFSFYSHPHSLSFSLILILTLILILHVDLSRRSQHRKYQDDIQARTGPLLQNESPENRNELLSTSTPFWLRRGLLVCLARPSRLARHDLRVHSELPRLFSSFVLERIAVAVSPAVMSCHRAALQCFLFPGLLSRRRPPDVS